MVKEWQKLRLADESAAEYFNGGPSNLGLLLGAASRGIVDGDLDCPEAVILAPRFLPETPCKFGRRSTGASHWVWRPTPSLPTTPFRDVEKGEDGKRAMLVELRADGAQTIVPPNVHPSGERVMFLCDDFVPAKVDGNDLLRRMQLLAIACILRASTAATYKQRLALWAYGHVLPDGRALGDLPVNEVRREHLGAVLVRVREAGRSMAIRHQIRNPLVAFYRWHIELKRLPEPNPAADLRFFMGKGPSKRASRRVVYFAPEQAPQLLQTCKAAFPRWHAFIATGLLAGLRWGESAALQAGDVDWKRGRLHVARTFSERGLRIEPCKDKEDRWVKLTPTLAGILRDHLEAVALEGQVKGWPPEQRQLAFPNTLGRPARHPLFLQKVWKPLLLKAGLPYRNYHATRHSFAVWHLENGADIRWVQEQLGHASIAQTADTYGHLMPERHQHEAERLDQFLRV